jgi:hypothetical protein
MRILGACLTLALLVAGLVLIPVALSADPNWPCVATQAAIPPPSDRTGLGFLAVLNTQVGSTLLASVQQGLWTAVLGAATLVGLPVILAAGVLAAADLPRRLLRSGR